MNAGVSCDYYWCLTFFGFLRPGLSLWGYRNRCILVAMCYLIVRIPNLEVATKRLLHQHVKIPGIVLLSMLCLEVCPYSYFRWCGYFRGPWVSFVTTDKFSVRFTKITSRISWTHSLPLCFLPIFNSVNNDHIIKRKLVRFVFVHGFWFYFI